ncbi:MAG: TrmB family transcriptional regulator, partial [Promethearchaeota archaeon]
PFFICGTTLNQKINIFCHFYFILVVNFMKNNDTYTALKTIGLTDYETRAYVVLMENKPLKASAVSKLAKIPHSKTYEVLSRLEKRALIEVQYSRPMLYQALNPNYALQELIDKLKIQEEMQFREQTLELEKKYQHTMDQLVQAEHTALENLSVLNDQSTAIELTADTVWTIRGSENLLLKLKELLKRVRNKVQLMLPRDDFSSIIKPLITSAKKGVKIQLLVHFITPTVKQLQKYAEVFQEEAPLPTNCGIVIVDNCEAMFLSENFETGFSTDSASIVMVLAHFYEHEIIESTCV